MNGGKADAVHRHRHQRIHRRGAARILPGDSYVHEFVQNEWQRGRVDIARAPDTKAVVADSQVENGAVVVGRGVEQRNERIAIAEIIVESLDLELDAPRCQRPGRVQRIAQLAGITGIGIDDHGDVGRATARCPANTVNGDNELGCRPVYRGDLDGIGNPVALNQRGYRRVRRYRACIPRFRTRESRTSRTWSWCSLCSTNMSSPGSGSIMVTAIGQYIGTVAIDRANQVKEDRRRGITTGAAVEHGHALYRRNPDSRWSR